MDGNAGRENWRKVLPDLLAECTNNGPGEVEQQEGRCLKLLSAHVITLCVGLLLLCSLNAREN